MPTDTSVWSPPEQAAWVRDVNAGKVPLLTEEFGRRLDPAQLKAEARATTGLDDFGEFDGPRELLDEALTVLTGSLEEEARLSLLGRIEVRRQILRLLQVRLLITRHLTDDPGTRDEPVTAPVFVTGAPRTGTSILHALLAQDPANRVPEGWEYLRPVPPPSPDTFADDPRIPLVDAELRMTAMIAPGFDAMHERGARLPKECISTQAVAFRSEDFPGKFRVPSYATWLAATDMRPAYAAHRTVLQILQRRFRGTTRWVLKSPAHLGTLDALLDTYPDARIAVTHRDPLKVLGSLASLLATIRSTHSDDVDAHELAVTQVEFYADSLDRYTARRRSGTGPGTFHDSSYAAFMTDAVGTVADLYATFGLELTDDARTRMAAYLDGRPQGKHGAHTYSLADFGLDAVTLTSRYAGYTHHFGVANEGGR